MARLTILGDVDLRTDNGAVVGSILSQPRRFALLVYLALDARGGGIQRDRLLGVFWPDIPQERGRQALRTALHFLRRSLGADAIITRGDLVLLDPVRIACDAVDLRAALDEGRGEEALRLYEGDLLPGFYIDGGSAEFERWLDDVRAELRRLAAGAAWELALAAERAQNPPAAGAWARRAAELSSHDEAATRRAIDLLGRIGDRAGALATYDDLARRLRDEFDAGPSADTEAVVARIRDAEATAAVDGAGPASQPESPESAATPTVERVAATATARTAPRRAGIRGAAARLRRSRPVRTLVSTVVTLILVASFYSLWGVDRADPARVVRAATLEPVIRVEPVRDFSAGGDDADLAGALTLELAASLGETPGLVVVPIDEGDPPRDSAHTGPGFVVRAGLIRNDSVARVSAMLLDAASGATLYRFTAERPLADPALTVDQLVRALGPAVRREVGRAVEDYERRSRARDLRALALVRNGIRDYRGADSARQAGLMEAAKILFQAADSQFTLAQTADPNWPEPSVQKAKVALSRMWLDIFPEHYDSAAIARALRDGLAAVDHAVEISRDDPAALSLRGRLAHWVWRTRSGGSAAADHEALMRARQDLNRAIALDPGDPYAWATLSAIHEAQGEFALANMAARKAFRADAFLGDADDILVRLFTSSLEIGDTAAARSWYGEIEQRLPRYWVPGYCRLQQLAWRGMEGMQPDSLWRLVDRTADTGPDGAAMRPQFASLAAVALARSGFTARAERALQDAPLAQASDSEVLQYEAWARLLLEQRQEAITLLRRAIAANPRYREMVLRSHRFDALRDDPAFLELSGEPD